MYNADSPFTDYTTPSFFSMTFIPSQPQAIDEAVDPFILYSRSLYNYTFLLWQESKRAADVSTRAEPAETDKEKTREEGVQPAIVQPRE